jgi:Fe-S-cluster containining protein
MRDSEAQDLAQESNPQAPIETLTQQMLNGAMHAHSMFGAITDRINAMEAALYGLADALIAQNALTPAQFQTFTEKVSRAIADSGQNLNGGVALRVDNPQAPGTQLVNCDERMHICKAVCCKLTFPLSAEEVESGIIQWELGRPYHNRTGKKGYCVHIAEKDGQCRCNIFDNRPKVCSRYSCAHDQRIWTDFEGMVLNDEWIALHLGEDKMRFTNLEMDTTKDA